MIVNINLDTAQPLSDTDKALLRALVGESGDVAPFNQSPTKVEEAEAPSAAATKPAAKKTATKKAAPKAKEPEPEPEAAEDGDDGDDGDNEFDTLRANARAKAAELLADGGRELVTAALEAVGAARVSAVPDEDLEEFLKALDAA